MVSVAPESEATPLRCVQRILSSKDPNATWMALCSRSRGAVPPIEGTEDSPT